MMQQPYNNNKFLKYSLMAILIALVMVTIFIRLRFLPTPLDRDVGEYAYAGQLMLQGVPPYSLAYNMKMPGIYAAFAAILWAFGQTQYAVNFGVLLINTATIIMLYFLTKRYFGRIAACAMAVFFAILSISNHLQPSANAENFVLLFAVPGIFFLMKFLELRKMYSLVLCGLLFGISFSMKQHAAAFILFALVCIAYEFLKNKPVSFRKLIFSLSIFSFFAVLPFVVTCFLLYKCGVFGRFWFWTFDYARHYVTITSYKDGFSNLTFALKKVISGGALIWLLGLIGFAGIFWNKELKKYRFFITALIICSFLSLCPGLYFREHYFLLFLPALAIAAGLGVAEIVNSLKLGRAQAFAGPLLILIIWGQSFYVQRQYLTASDPDVISRLNFGFYPFPECLRIADYIRKNTIPDDKILVFGSEPEIYFYSQRRSATSFIYTYPLMEIQPFAEQMQREMINQIEANKPKYVVVVRTIDSWQPWPNSVKTIFEWSNDYFAKHYIQTGLVEIMKDTGQTFYYFDQPKQPQKPDGWLMILKRND